MKINEKDKKEIIDLLNEILNNNDKILELINECKEDLKIIKD